MTRIIVVVEDKISEQENALEAIKAFYGPTEEMPRLEIIPGCPQVGLADAKTLVLFASNLNTAKSRVEFLRKLMITAEVGVLTDLMFPVEKGGEEEPNGLGVIAECIEAGVPVVVCSDTDHHAVGWLRTTFPILGKAHPIGNIPVILDTKDWVKAIGLLAEVMGGPSSQG